MPVKSPSIEDLSKELIDRVKCVKAFKDRAFSIYDVDDLAQKMAAQNSPSVAVAYESTTPHEIPNQASAPARTVKPGLLYMTQTFSILVGVEYSATAQTDAKPTATNLLGEVRGNLIGFKGVNGKPWRFLTEAPVGVDTRGVIWYGQLWQTDVPQESSLK